MAAPQVRCPGLAAPALLRSAGLAALLAVAAVALAQLALPWRPATLCTLRAVTGVPCPFCGTTTALVHLGAGEPAAALRASPLAVLGLIAAALRPLVPARPPRLPGVVLAAGGALVLVVSELWQLARFGLLG